MKRNAEIGLFTKSSLEIGVEPRQAARPGVLGGVFPVARPLVRVEGVGRIRVEHELGSRKSPTVTRLSPAASPSAEVVIISPATAFEAIAKPAMVAPAAVIWARNWRRDMPAYALEIQSFSKSMDTSFDRLA
jgi:hypothetical protein